MKEKKHKSPVTGKEYSSNQEPRYSGMPTFMRTPLATSLNDLDIALAGIPYDGGVTNRSGARHGPREIRNQSTLMRNIQYIIYTLHL